MAGFNFQPPPFTPPAGPQMLPFNPQQALAAFHPPPPMNMGGGMGAPGMAAPQQQQGFGAPQGAGMLSAALNGFKGFGVGPDGLPQSGLGNMTGNAAQNAVNQSGTVPADPSGFNSAFSFLGGGQPGMAGGDAFFSGQGL